jgi:TolB-like protein/Tfp pilus assembly protein PilF
MEDQERLTRALADKYVIAREIGSGGMATVYLAQDLKHDRKVALKVLKPELAAVMGTERFLAEIRTTANLTHPHILPLFDSGEAGGFLFYVMPYVEGENLRERLDREGQLPVNEAVGIAGHIADGLDSAHRQGVIHRDLKPDNILFLDGEPVIADFGIATAGATAGGTRLTETGVSIGTPQYMSPEQVTGDWDVDGRSDIYALGAVLYEMLTGEAPHSGKTSQVILARMLSENPTPIGDLRDTVPDHVEAAVHRSLAKTPADRFQTAAQFATALVDGEADNRLHRRRPKQRSPVVWLAAISAVVIVAVALLWEPWFAPSAVITSVAVLPLANLSGDSGQTVFVEGIHDALIAELQKLSAFERVISRTSVLRFRNTELSVPEIATALDVDAVIDGTVQRVGNTVRVRVTLIGAFPERDLWSKDYQSDLADVLTLQRTITGDIAREIALTITPTEEARLSQARPVNPEAFNLVLLGREAWNLRDGPGMRRAVALFNQAVAIDSTYAEAYVGLSEAYNMLLQYGFLPTEEGIPLALESAERALAFDSMEGGAYTALAEIHFLGREWNEAEPAYRRGIELNPGSAIGHHFFGWFLSHLGRHDEAIAMLTRARELDPLSAPINADLAAAYLHARRYDEAWTETERTLAIAHGFHRALWLQVALDVLSEGNLDRAMASATELEGQMLFYRSSLALPLAAAGREEEARALLAEDIAESGGAERLSRSGALIAATVYLELGDTVATWEMLERMADVGIGAGITSLAVWPFFDPLREDPRFADLLARTGYPK